MQALSGLYVPEPGGVVHGAGGQHGAVRIEGQTNDLRGVAPVCVVQLPSLCTPQLAGLIC